MLRSVRFLADASSQTKDNKTKNKKHLFVIRLVIFGSDAGMKSSKLYPGLSIIWFLPSYWTHSAYTAPPDSVTMIRSCFI